MGYANAGAAQRVLAAGAVVVLLTVVLRVIMLVSSNICHRITNY